MRDKRYIKGLSRLYVTTPWHQHRLEWGWCREPWLDQMIRWRIETQQDNSSSSKVTQSPFSFFKQEAMERVSGAHTHKKKNLHTQADLITNSKCLRGGTLKLRPILIRLILFASSHELRTIEMKSSLELNLYYVRMIKLLSSLCSNSIKFNLSWAIEACSLNVFIIDLQLNFWTQKTYHLN